MRLLFRLKIDAVHHHCELNECAVPNRPRMLEHLLDGGVTIFVDVVEIEILVGHHAVGVGSFY